MDKLDLSKLYKSYYTAQMKPQWVEFEPACYTAITGQGDPDGEAFARATEALYTISYGVKGLCKAEGQILRWRSWKGSGGSMATRERLCRCRVRSGAGSC